MPSCISRILILPATFLAAIGAWLPFHKISSGDRSTAKLVYLIPDDVHSAMLWPATIFALAAKCYFNSIFYDCAPQQRADCQASASRLRDFLLAENRHCLMPQ
jgi:hypothetical protein